jgi:pimeloyl-ACP methyl ester carboxylesterase
MQATVVLVHGAWAGPWTWDSVVKGLDERGVKAVAVELPSCTKNDPTVGFKQDAAAVRDVLDGINGPIVLVGNSYGGVVITEAAHPGVSRLVYLAAFMPPTGVVPMSEMMPASDPGFSGGIKFRDDMLSELDEDVMLNYAFQQAPPDQLEIIKAHGGTAMSFGADMEASITKAAWDTTPSTYVVCTEDRSIRPEMQREWAKTRATDSIEWPSDHCAQHSHPDLVIDLLAKLAAENGA